MESHCKSVGRCKIGIALFPDLSQQNIFNLSNGVQRLDNKSCTDETKLNHESRFVLFISYIKKKISSSALTNYIMSIV